MKLKRLTIDASIIIIQNVYQISRFDIKFTNNILIDIDCSTSKSKSKVRWIFQDFRV